MHNKEYEAYQGEDGTWGVVENGAVLYDPQFCRLTADAIADLYNSEEPPKDWEETSRKLDVMGLPY